MSVRIVRTLQRLFLDLEKLGFRLCGQWFPLARLPTKLGALPWHVVG